MYRVTIHKTKINTYKLCKLNIPIQSNFHFKKFTSSEEKLRNNILRAKSKVYDYALNNDFYFYVTLTTNQNLIDRFNLKLLIDNVSQFIRDLRKKFKKEFYYILIPEKHENGAWHLHGLFNYNFAYDMYINKNKYLSWSSFDKIGFSNIQIINNLKQVSDYITKYINKDFADRKKGDRLYFCSKGLKSSTKILDFITSDNIDKLDFDFISDYCSVIYSNDICNLLNLINDKLYCPY